jgi:SNF2 family DNA or RNA helicase
VKLHEWYKWQATEIECHAFDAKRAIFADPRLGKTLAASESLSRVSHSTSRVLVVCPLVVSGMWARHLAERGTCGEIRVINFDRLSGQLAALKKWGPTHVIVDESHYIKGVSSQRGRAVRALCRDAAWVRLLTGTPAPNHYGDLWGQLAALDEEVWGRYFKSFRERYLICDPIFPTRVLGHQNVDELMERLKPYVTWVKRSDVFGPDRWQESICDVPLSKEAGKLYYQLAKAWIAEDPGITATHTLSRMTKLRQCTTGVVIADDKQPHIIDSGKLKAVMRDVLDIRGIGEKCVIFYQYAGEGAEYLKALENLRPGVPYGVIRGDTPLAERDRLVERSAAPGPFALLVQMKAGGIGITLRHIQHALVPTLTFSYAEYKQAIDRIYSPDESRSVTHYMSPGTIDEFLMKTLQRKEEVNHVLQRASIASIAFGG